MQNRGQLSAGMTSYNPDRQQLLETYRGLGSVSEVFRLSHRGKAESIMAQYAGRAAIGHVRYATCGEDDLSYAQPFERHHLQKHKWFSFGFNGQLANYAELRDKLLADDDHHLARATDTEIIMHEISRELSGDRRPPLVEVMRNVAQRFDGAYCLVLLNALGEMVVARDPLGIAAAVLCDRRAAVGRGQRERGPVESRLLAPTASARCEPGEMIYDQRRRDSRSSGSPTARGGPIASSSGFISPTSPARWTAAACTWRARRWAKSWPGWKTSPIDDDTIVVPVPDTSKCAADAMAYRLGVPSVEGLIRNRYSGRTFIEGTRQPREQGGGQVHAAPRSARRQAGAAGRGLDRPLDDDAGADLADSRGRAGPRDSRPRRLPADRRALLLRHRHVDDRRAVRAAVHARGPAARKKSTPRWPASWAPIRSATCRSSRSPRPSTARPSDLCRACITGHYPTPHGQQLYQIALANAQARHIETPASGCRPLRTYETPGAQV